MRYEYTEKYIPVGKKGWRELGAAMVELPSEGWELFMAVPINSLTAFIPGISAAGQRRSSTTFVDPCRRESISSFGATNATGVDEQTALNYGCDAARARIKERNNQWSRGDGRIRRVVPPNGSLEPPRNHFT